MCVVFFSGVTCYWALTNARSPDINFLCSSSRFLPYCCIEDIWTLRCISTKFFVPVVQCKKFSGLCRQICSSLPGFLCLDFSQLLLGFTSYFGIYFGLAIEDIFLCYIVCLYDVWVHVTRYYIEKWSCQMLVFSLYFLFILQVRWLFLHSYLQAAGWCGKR